MMFETMNQIKKIKVDGQSIRKLCTKHNLSLNYIEYDSNRYPEAAVVILHFYNKCNEDDFNAFWSKLYQYDEVRAIVTNAYVNDKNQEITVADIILDGILYDETEEN